MKETIGDLIMDNIKEQQKKHAKSKKAEGLKKQMANIQCKCSRQKSNENHRKKYGVCKCDTYAGRLPSIIANFLFQYVIDAEAVIVRDNWNTIIKHARTIKAYAESERLDEKIYKKETKAYEKSMKWLIKEMDTLWW